MAEPLRSLPDDDPAPRTGPRPRPLVAVPSTPSAGRPPGDRPAPGSIGRSAGIGAGLGFLVVTSAVAALTVVAGMGLASGLALGAYVGSFGGAGFGGMVGTVLALVRRDAAERAQEGST